MDIKKKGQMFDSIGWWVIALIVLVVVISFYFTLKGRGEGAIGFLKNLINFR